MCLTSGDIATQSLNWEFLYQEKICPDNDEMYFRIFDISMRARFIRLMSEPLSGVTGWGHITIIRTCEAI